MKYMHQNIIRTGTNSFSSREELFTFLSALETVNDTRAAIESYANRQKEQGKIIGSSIELISPNEYKTIKFFNTPEDRRDYMNRLGEYADTAWPYLSSIGWSWVAQNNLTEITEERWEEIQQSLAS
jgi:hypothetical protein